MRTIPIQEPIQYTNTGSSVTVIRDKDYLLLNNSGLGIVSTNFTKDGTSMTSIIIIYCLRRQMLWQIKFTSKSK